MLNKWKKMEPALNLLAADNESIKQKYPTDDDRLNINVKDTINNLAKYYSATTSTASSTTGSELLVDTRKYFRKLCNINTDPNNSALQSNSSNNLAGDLEKYLLHDLEDNIEPLLWWKA
ncbi:unnamed protein product [Rhizophagus irregularis]|nr:unnamed protein product [Rhizophagus irregularis]